MRKALIIDDSQAMRRSIVYALQRLDEIVCVEARDGAEGVKRLASEKFDIIILDINMPVMDGLKLVAHSRLEGSAHQTTPIIVISTEAAPEDRRRALELGANAYLVKPLRANTVLETVKQLLERETRR